MKQIATGIQTTGSPHLGNIVGAIRPAIAASKDSSDPAVFIVADMHSMLTVRSSQLRSNNTHRVAAAWIAFGATEHGIMYRQSQIPELSEIAMLISGTASMKKVMEGSLKSEVFASIHPVLMTADLLMVGTTHVPVGVDSREHIDIVQDTARRFNEVYGEVFAVPQGVFAERQQTVPGTDGKKMSKSLDNIIDVLTEPEVIAQIVRRVPDPVLADADGGYSLPSEIVVNIANSIGAEDIVADPSLTADASKSNLIDYLVEEFRPEREQFRRLMAEPQFLKQTLANGEGKVAEQAQTTLNRMKLAMGMR